MCGVGWKCLRGWSSINGGVPVPWLALGAKPSNASVSNIRNAIRRLIRGQSGGEGVDRLRERDRETALAGESERE